MLESYLVARDRLLKPGGKMYPDQAVLYAAPFTDAALYAEQQQKLHFWAQTSFYGVDLSSLQESAERFYFSQPVVGPVAPHSLLAAPAALEFDFTTMTLGQLQKFELPFSFVVTGMAQLHGFALWFASPALKADRAVVLDGDHPVMRASVVGKGAAGGGGGGGGAPDRKSVV